MSLFSSIWALISKDAIKYQTMRIAQNVISAMVRTVKPITDFWSGRLSGDIKNTIHEVAANQGISGKLIKTAESRLHVMRKGLFKLICISGLIGEIPVQGLKLAGKGYLLDQYQLAGTGTPNFAFIWECAGAYYIVMFWKWRDKNKLARSLSYLVAALEAGLKFRDGTTDQALKDAFASSVQKAALNYRNVFKFSDSTSFFKAQVRKTAKSCSNNIMSLVPGIVSADREEIESINRDLARLIIRSQTGYWYQTEDIAKHGVPLTRPNAIRITLITFIKDRTIQVASIALFATLLSVTLASVLPLLSKHK